jgi:hypothetical protein
MCSFIKITYANCDDVVAHNISSPAQSDVTSCNQRRASTQRNAFQIAKIVDHALALHCVDI